MHYPSVNNKSLSKIKPASFPLTAIFSCLPVFCLAVSFFLRPANLQNSLSEILSYLGSSLIPALFPFLLLGHLCVKEPVFCLLERLFSPLSLLLKQERSVPVLLFLSLLGAILRSALFVILVASVNIFLYDGSLRVYLFALAALFAIGLIKAVLLPDKHTS